MPKHLLDENEARLLLTEAAWGRLASIGPAGPYITPLHFVLNQNTIYFHSSPRGQKIDNIAQDRRVCFEVSELLKIGRAPEPCKFYTRFKSVQVFGQAEVVQKDEEKVAALNLLSEKYYGSDEFNPITMEQIAAVAVIALRIEKISGRANLDY